jgi:hypothetical protein
MEKQLPNEECASVLGLALAIWGAAVAFGAGEGVFAKLSPATLAAVAIFALAYVPATVLLDRGIGEFLARVDARVMGLALVVFAILLVGLALSGEGPLLARLGQQSGAMAAFFVAPVIAGLATGAVFRSLGAPRSAPAKSPGATPAAT